MKKLVFVSLILIFSLAMLAPALSAGGEPEQLYWQFVSSDNGVYYIESDEDIDDELVLPLEDSYRVRFLTAEDGDVDQHVIPAADVIANTTVAPSGLVTMVHLRDATDPYFKITAETMGEGTLSIVSGGITYEMELTVKPRQLYYYEIEETDSGGYQTVGENENELSLVAGESIDLQFANGRDDPDDLLNSVTDISTDGVTVTPLESGSSYFTVTAGNTPGDYTLSITVGGETYALDVEVVPPQLYLQYVWRNNAGMQFGGRLNDQLNLELGDDSSLRFLTDDDDDYQGADSTLVLNTAATGITIETHPAGCISVEVAEDFAEDAGGPFFTVKADKVGKGTISISSGGKTYVMEVKVALPDVGFFTRQEYSEEACAAESLDMTEEEEREFYLMVEDGFSETVKTGDKITITPPNGYTCETEWITRGNSSNRYDLKVTLTLSVPTPPRTSYLQAEMEQDNDTDPDEWRLSKLVVFNPPQFYCQHVWIEDNGLGLSPWIDERINLGLGHEMLVRFLADEQGSQALDLALKDIIIDDAYQDYISVEEYSTSVAGGPVFIIRGEAVGDGAFKIIIDGKTHMLGWSILLPEEGFFSRQEYSEDAYIKQAEAVDMTVAANREVYFMCKDGFVAAVKNLDEVTIDPPVGYTYEYEWVERGDSGVYDLKVTLTPTTPATGSSMQATVNNVDNAGRENWIGYMRAGFVKEEAAAVSFTYDGQEYEIGFCADRLQGTAFPWGWEVSMANDDGEVAPDPDPRYLSILYRDYDALNPELYDYVEAAPAIYDLIEDVDIYLGKINYNNGRIEKVAPGDYDDCSYSIDGEPTIDDDGRHKVELEWHNKYGLVYLLGDVSFTQDVSIDGVNTDECRVGLHMRNDWSYRETINLNDTEYSGWDIDDINDFFQDKENEMDELVRQEGLAIHYYCTMQMAPGEYNGTLEIPPRFNLTLLGSDQGTTLRGGMYSRFTTMFCNIENINFVSAADNATDLTYGSDDLPNQGVYGSATYGAGNVRISDCSFEGYYTAVNSYGGRNERSHKITLVGENVFRDNHIGLLLDASHAPEIGGIITQGVEETDFIGNDYGVWIKQHSRETSPEALFYCKNCNFINNDNDIVNDNSANIGNGGYYWLLADHCFFGTQVGTADPVRRDPIPAPGNANRLIVYPTYLTPWSSDAAAPQLYIPTTAAASVIMNQAYLTLLDDEFKARLKISDMDHFDIDSGEYQTIATWDFSASAGGAE